ncbi:MAG: hypothetical protein JST27_05650 [Bacteroidetes bacterium]|nr:hypothetical protein [Bacteroidota bacterium]
MNNKTSKVKEVAKLFAGMAVHDTLVHWAFGISGKFPIELSPLITITKDLNTFSMIFWPLVAAVLIYYAWFKK